MDLNYWSFRWDVLGDEVTQQLIRVNDIKNFSDAEIVNWGMKMKELGNARFKTGNFIEAATIYETIADWIVPIIPNMTESVETFLQFGVPCLLNQAACFLKFKEFDKCIVLCSDILKLDDNNAKGFFRRAQAYAGKGDMNAALLDFKQAQALEPRDKLIRSEVEHIQRLVTNLEESSQQKSEDKKRKLDSEEEHPTNGDGLEVEVPNQVDLKKREDVDHEHTVGSKDEKKRRLAADLKFNPLGIHNIQESTTSSMDVAVTMYCIPPEKNEENDTKVFTGEHLKKIRGHAHIYHRSKNHNLRLKINFVNLEKLRQGKEIQF